MTYRPPPVQPLWSFASVATQYALGVSPATLQPLSAPVAGWSTGPDGRPRAAWAVRRPASPS